MSERIIDGTQLNSENLYFGAPKATAQGSKSVNILNPATKTGLTLSTPLMLTWGATDYKAEGEEKGNGKFELSLQFPNDEYATDDTRAFLENLKSLESKIKSEALVRSKDWFGKVHKSPDIIEALWTPMLKYPKDKNTGEPDHTKKPTLRVKVPQWEGVWKSEIYDEDGNKLFPNAENPMTPLDYLKKGSNIMCLIQFGGIWFVNGKFSANWKLIQAVVQKPRAALHGQCFIKLKTQDKEKLQKQQVAEDDTAVDDNIGSTIVDDTDEEEEVEGEEEQETIVVSKKVAPPPAPAPAPAPAAATEVKKRIIKKKD
jgi:hypothetical protein